MKLLRACFNLLGCTCQHLLLWEAEVTAGEAKLNLPSLCVEGAQANICKVALG